MYRTVSRGIEVKVTPRFLPDRSSPDNGYYFWAYTITLTNLGRETVQLKTRHWRITDALGRLQEVRGAGVIGKEPVLRPGEDFEYTSGVPLPTPSGFMTGTYGMVTEAGEPFDIDIPAFSLDTPQGGPSPTGPAKAGPMINSGGGGIRFSVRECDNAKMLARIRHRGGLEHMA
jgi:ApaG protein